MVKQTMAQQCALCSVAQSCLTLCDPTFVRGDSLGRSTGVGSHSLLMGYSQPRDQTQVSYIAVGFLTTEPPGKPKNTGMGNLSLLQGIFPIQESNWGLMHCRWSL